MRRIGTLVVAVLAVTATAPGGFAIAAAQESPPGDPANFYGAIVDESGTAAPAGTTIVAVVDGELKGEITVDTPGKYGGNGAFHEKLSLDSEAGDTVRFHVDDVDGPEAIQRSPLSLDAGTQELNLTFPDGSFEGTDDSDDDIDDSDGDGENGNDDRDGDDSDDSDGDDDSNGDGENGTDDRDDDDSDDSDDDDDSDDEDGGTDETDPDDGSSGGLTDADLIVLVTALLLTLLAILTWFLDPWS